MSVVSIGERNTIRSLDDCKVVRGAHMTSDDPDREQIRDLVDAVESCASVGGTVGGTIGRRLTTVCDDGRRHRAHSVNALGTGDAGVDLTESIDSTMSTDP